jgi:hypothetical protein
MEETLLMKEKICLIYQPCGLGDILFIQKVAKHWHAQGYKVIIPVVYELEWLNDYIDNVTFVSWGDKGNLLTHKDKLPDDVDFPYKERYDPFAPPSTTTDDFVFLNFFADPVGPIMAYKYFIANLDYQDWEKHLTFNRDTDKENKLYHDVLGLEDGEEYVFINKLYQTRPHLLSYDRIQSDSSYYNGKKVVEMSIVDGYTIFDWLKVVEQASEIHMIESAMNYVLETDQVKLRATIMNLYSRINNFGQVQYLFKLPWNYIT